MKALIQRVSSASVIINNQEYSQIHKGLCIFLGIKDTDQKSDVQYLIDKIIKLRIFPDENNMMNKSLCEIKGSILVVSQFTLYANCSKGNRPSFKLAANKLIATPLYDLFINLLKEKKLLVKTGKFGYDMKINLTNDGPVSIILES